MKKRIDLILVDQKIAESRNKAQAMIMAGQISVDGKKILKSGEIFDENVEILTKDLNPKWVSRGSLKLLHAFDFFKIEVKDFTCLDIGASTGGFTQVLLSKKVKKIYSVDVGKNQLHEKLIQDPKIINLSKKNARYLNKEMIKEPIDIIVCDVSFISMKKVILPNLTLLSKKNPIILGLIKPQFECNKSELKRGGVILDTKIHKRICKDFTNWFESVCKMDVKGIIESPIKGPKGNTEFLIYALKKS